MRNKNRTLPRDDDEVAIQVSSRFVTSDISGTPKNSPLAVSSSELALKVPENAVVLWLNPSAAMRVKDITSGTAYFVAAANVWVPVPVAGMTNVYVIRDSGDLTLQFYFEVVGALAN